jgi:hypothetical protein
VMARRQLSAMHAGARGNTTIEAKVLEAESSRERTRRDSMLKEKCNKTRNKILGGVNEWLKNGSLEKNVGCLRIYLLAPLKHFQ